MKLKIIRKDKLSNEEQNTLWDGIESYTQAIVGDTGRHELSYLLHNDDGEMLGGIQGNYDNFSWLWIDSLWVSKDLRGQGYGIELLKKIEDEAIKNGCLNSHLTSFSYQAADFYIKQGYETFGELENYTQGKSRFWLKKRLLLEDKNIENKRVVFDFEIDFSNGGGIQGQEFRLDIIENDIDDKTLANYIVKDMRLLMVSEVRILNKKIIIEKHKR